MTSSRSLVIFFNYLQCDFILKAHISHIQNKMRCLDKVELKQILISMTKLLYNY